MRMAASLPLLSYGTSYIHVNNRHAHTHTQSRHTHTLHQRNAINDTGEFLVVATLGQRGVGKSTVLNLVYGNSSSSTAPFVVNHNALLDAAREQAHTHTNGIGIEAALTGDRYSNNFLYTFYITYCNISIN
eukprot:GHVR01023380.1.p3 GENE.GHVR01023380.1~~GHVR01023380.1.p3  ORF type:complete len:131 (-),score=56.18 GHVR01023380.1:644-1036(-)